MLLALASTLVINLHDLSPDCLQRLLSRSDCPWWGVAPLCPRRQSGAARLFRSGYFSLALCGGLGVSSESALTREFVIWLSLWNFQRAFISAGIKLLPSDMEKELYDASLHLPSFWERFCPLFLSVRENFFDFFLCSKDWLGNSLMVNPFLAANFINSQTFNLIFPKSAKLRFG